MNCAVVLAFAMIDHLFQPTYEIPLLAGKNLTAEDARNGYTQSNTLLLNETAARQMGFERCFKTRCFCN